MSSPLAGPAGSQVDNSCEARNQSGLVSRQHLPDCGEIVSLRAPHDGDWTVVGQPLGNGVLQRRIVDAVGDLAGLAGLELSVDGLDERDFPSVLEMLDRAHDHVAKLLLETPKRGRVDNARLVPLLVGVERLRFDVAEARTVQRQQRFREVRAALSRLRGICTVEKMLVRAPIELCRCGFDRVIVSRVRESTWEVERVHVEDDPGWAADIERVARENPQVLDHMLVESEMMRRRAPVLIEDAQADERINLPIKAASLSRSYVAAPIMPEGHIIGFLHADCYMSRRHVDQDDLAVLWMFVEGFGYAFSRTALLERLRRARDQVQGLTRSMATEMDSMCGGDVALQVSDGNGGDHADGAAPASLVPPESRLEALLSPREIEVIGLMAQGKSNGEIAMHLVISEGTVKSHVKHILRKLRAANRAEAVFRFMRLTAIHGPRAG